MKRYWFFGYLIGYLSIQIHEALHWLVACILGFRGAVGGYSYSLYVTGQPWQYIAIAAAGTFSAVAFAVMGVLLHRSKIMPVKMLGFLLVFVNAAGRILYEFSGFFIQESTDETAIAYHLGVPDFLLRVPVTLFCFLTLIYVLRDTETGLGKPVRLAVLFVSLMAAISQVLVLGAWIDELQALGFWMFQPVLLGYVPFLAAVNLFFLVIFCLAVWRESRLPQSEKELRQIQP